MVQAMRTLSAALDGPGAGARVASRTTSGGALPPTPGAPPAAPGERFATAALVVANLAPLVGVLGFGWDTGAIVLLYWCENIVAGFYTGLRMATADGPAIAKLFMIPFFTFHYGMFCAVHGSFVVAIFHLEKALHLKGFTTPPELFRAAASLPGMALPILALFVSHGVSFIENHFVRGERHTADLGTLMMRPYGRMIVLHVAIIFGGFAAQAAGSPTALLVVLVLLKLAVDAGTHRRFVSRAAAAGPVAAAAGN